jgi:hypothetical protein
VVPVAVEATRLWGRTVSGWRVAGRAAARDKRKGGGGWLSHHANAH